MTRRDDFLRAADAINPVNGETAHIGIDALLAAAILLREAAGMVDEMQWFDWPGGEVKHGRLYLAKLVRGGMPILVSVEAAGEEVSFYYDEKDQYLTVDPVCLKWTGEMF